MSIGLLGLGNYSTLHYIDQLNRRYNARKGGYSTCPMVMWNVDFDKINPYLPNDFEQLAQPLQLHLEALHFMGVSRIIVPNITLHEAIEQLPSHQASPYPLVHPITVTIEKLLADQRTEAYLFGSLYSMEAPYLREQFYARGITLLQPEEADKAFLDSLRQQVYQGTETPATLEQYAQLIACYGEERAVVIACTELSVALQEPGSSIYDMVGLQIENALEYVS